MPDLRVQVICYNVGGSDTVNLTARVTELDYYDGPTRPALHGNAGGVSFTVDVSDGFISRGGVRGMYSLKDFEGAEIGVFAGKNQEAFVGRVNSVELRRSDNTNQVFVKVTGTDVLGVLGTSFVDPDTRIELERDSTPRYTGLSYSQLFGIEITPNYVIRMGIHTGTEFRDGGVNGGGFGLWSRSAGGARHALVRGGGWGGICWAGNRLYRAYGGFGQYFISRYTVAADGMSVTLDRTFGSKALFGDSHNPSRDIRSQRLGLVVVGETGWLSAPLSGNYSWPGRRVLRAFNLSDGSEVSSKTIPGNVDSSYSANADYRDIDVRGSIIYALRADNRIIAIDIGTRAHLPSEDILSTDDEPIARVDPDGTGTQDDPPTQFAMSDDGEYLFTYSYGGSNVRTHLATGTYSQTADASRPAEDTGTRWKELNKNAWPSSQFPLVTRAADEYVIVPARAVTGSLRDAARRCVVSEAGAVSGRTFLPRGKWIGGTSLVRSQAHLAIDDTQPDSLTPVTSPAEDNDYVASVSQVVLTAVTGEKESRGQAIGFGNPLRADCDSSEVATKALATLFWNRVQSIPEVVKVKIDTAFELKTDGEKAITAFPMSSVFLDYLPEGHNAASSLAWIVLNRRVKITPMPNIGPRAVIDFTLIDPAWFGIARVDPSTTAPDVPDGVRAVPGDGSVGLFWNSVSGATSYQHRRRRQGTSTWTQVSAGNVLSAAISGLTNGTAYEFQVRATNSHGSSKWSSAITAVPAAASPTATVPGKVTGLTVTAGTSPTLDAAWTAPSNGGAAITGYRIEYRVTGSGDAVWAHALPTGTSHTITGIASTTYDVRVRAINSVGNGPWSDVVTGTTAASTPSTGIKGPVLSLGPRIGTFRNFAWTYTFPAQTSPRRFELQIRDVGGEWPDTDIDVGHRGRNSWRNIAQTRSVEARVRAVYQSAGRDIVTAWSNVVTSPATGSSGEGSRNPWALSVVTDAMVLDTPDNPLVSPAEVLSVLVLEDTDNPLVLGGELIIVRSYA